MFLDVSDPHVAPLCIHNKPFDPSLQQFDGGSILVLPMTLLRCPQTVTVVLTVDIDLVVIGVVTRWKCGAAFILQDISHIGCIPKAFRVCQNLNDSLFCAVFIHLSSAFFFYSSVVEYRILYAGFLCQGELI